MDFHLRLYSVNQHVLITGHPFEKQTEDLVTLYRVTAPRLKRDCLETFSKTEAVCLFCRLVDSK